MEGFDIAKLPLDMLLNLLNIFILYLIVRRFVYKPVRKFLDARVARVNAAAGDAEQKKADAAKLKADYEALLADSKAKAQDVIRDGRKKAVEEAAAVLADARKEADGMIAAAIVKIKEEREASVKAMNKEITALAVGISEKLLAREVTQKDNQRIVDEFLQSGDMRTARETAQ
jgi:F-type H+-transporting ATPase subunit b